MDIYKKLNKFGFAAALLAGVVFSVIAIAAAFGGENLDVAVYGMYFFIVIAAVAALGLPLINAIDNPKSLIRVGAGILVAAIVFGISYAMSSETDISSLKATKDQIKMSGALLNTMWAFMILAAVAIIGTEVFKIVKK